MVWAHTCTSLATKLPELVCAQEAQGRSGRQRVSLTPTAVPRRTENKRRRGCWGGLAGPKESSTVLQSLSRELGGKYTQGEAQRKNKLRCG